MGTRTKHRRCVPFARRLQPTAEEEAKTEEGLGWLRTKKKLWREAKVFMGLMKERHSTRWQNASTQDKQAARRRHQHHTQAPRKQNRHRPQSHSSISEASGEDCSGEDDSSPSPSSSSPSSPSSSSSSSSSSEEVSSDSESPKGGRPY